MADDQTRLLQEILELQKSHKELSQRQFEWENKSRNGARIARIAIMLLLILNSVALIMVIDRIQAIRPAIAPPETAEN